MKNKNIGQSAAKCPDLGKSSTTIPNGSTSHNETSVQEKAALFKFYVLIDPTDDKIKYVGRTKDLTNRYRNHIYEAKTRNRNKRERWIVSLLRKNKKPIMKTIYEKECFTKEAQTIENMLIKSFSKRYELKNGSDKGLGFPIVTRPVYMYDLGGTLENSFLNAHQAMIATGVKDCNIVRCAKNENGYGTKTAGNKFWSFIKYDRYPHKFIKNWRSLKGKPVQQFDLNGKFIAEFQTARKAEKETGVPYKKISSCCNGRQKTAHGFIWKLK